MAKKYFSDDFGNKYTVDFYSVIEDGKIWCDIYANGFYHDTKHLKTYYREERTWDDHMGNTPCGYYVLCPVLHGKRKRVYVF